MTASAAPSAATAGPSGPAPGGTAPLTPAASAAGPAAARQALRQRGARLRRRLTRIGLSLAFVAAVGSGMTAITVLAPAPVIDWSLRDAIVSDAMLWRQRLLDQLERGSDTFARAAVTEADEGYLMGIPKASNLYRLKLFDAEGRVFWSTRPDLVGATISSPELLEVLAAGAVFYEQEKKAPSEIDQHRFHMLTSEMEHGAHDHDIAEMYTPVMENGRMVGAIEFYADLTTLREPLVDKARAALALLTVLVTLVAAGAVVISGRRSKARYLAMRDRAAAEKTGLERQMRLARDVQLLGELNEWLQSSASLDELFEMVARFMTHMLPEVEGSVYVYSNSRDVLDGMAAWNGGRAADHIRPDSCWGLRRGRSYAYGSSEVNFACAHVPDVDDRAYYCFPILAHGETVGLMHVRARPEITNARFRELRKLAQMCAEQISLAIANVRMRDQLHDQSVRDPLTGLYNRRHLTEALRRAIDGAARSMGAAALLSFDVDHFKKFNDTHGHDAGDMVLRAVGSAMDALADGDEAACRTGGEEFMLLLPEADAEAAMDRAELLRRTVEAVTVRYGEKTLPHISISVGVAVFPDHGRLPQDLMRAADEALYEAKHRGRNQVVLAGSGAALDAPGTAEAQRPAQPVATDTASGQLAALRSAPSTPDAAPQKAGPAPEAALRKATETGAAPGASPRKTAQTAAPRGPAGAARNGPEGPQKPATHGTG
ncbi:diguanylate cyclase [Roseivivax sp. GX 12232]|uniref:diguanylate cyclase n=1 Tax=Roseivivax sp. GX 12232 TaxID=2900547 RepID=UPI001E2CDB68|nr:diguanylate cyclase [Roseivivax sp. GX 12232]MCE0504379.1 diguanylate cyclase [Roseivivax sp. GX 12232]